MTEPRQSALYNIVAKAIAAAVLQGVVRDVAYVANKARHLCYCASAGRRDAAVNSIYAKCEAEIALGSPAQLRAVLERLRRYSPYVQDAAEFWRLHDSLLRFTHCGSFFTVCMPTVVATLATLLTLVLANQLLYAAEMVEAIEGYLFDAPKPLSQDLADLLDMKYGLVNLLQYKILPLVLGARDECAGASAGAGDGAAYAAEVEQLLTLPVRCGILEDVYQHLLKQGVPAASNYAEYVAGLKISELPAPGEAPGEAPGPAPGTAPGPAPGTVRGHATGASPAAAPGTVPSARLPIPAALRRLAAAATAEDRRLLESAQRYAKGHVLDGAVVSPLTEETHFIPLSMADIQKFMILDYLYTIRVLARCVQQKNSGSRKRAQGVTLTINSPFKIISVPGK
ncbi:virion phosphoprotein [Equine molluscum contagiosum-like virus]|nr:virion phosphoprotein [Equine molluscum contagiosum-like virus]